MAQSNRLFVAIDLPDDIREVVREYIGLLHRVIPQQAVRWVPPPNLHLTLKFLGDTPETAIESISTGLGESAKDHAAFDIAIKGAGCFPSIRRPRVIWLGLKTPSDEITALHKNVEKYIAPLGYPTEKRPFSPHLTIGRMKRDISSAVLSKVGKGIGQVPKREVAVWKCDAIRLVKSDLMPGGPVYTCLAEFPLK